MRRARPLYRLDLTLALGGTAAWLALMAVIWVYA
jgi:hypothetical protein